MSESGIRYIYRRRRWLLLFGALDRIGGWFHRPVEGIPDLSGARSILVLKLDQVGDLILTRPLLAALRRAAPAARIELVVGRDRRAVVERFPEVDDVREFPVRLRPGETGIRFSPGTLLAAVRDVRRLGHEVTVAAKEEPLTVMLTRLIGSPVRIGFREGGLGFLLTHAVPVEEGIHEFRVLAALAGEAGEGGSAPAYPVTEEEYREADRVLGSLDLPESLPVVVVHPGSGILPRRWAWKRFAETIRLVSRDMPVAFLIVQGPEDGVPEEEIPGVEAPSVVRRLSRPVGLGVLAALLKRADLLVGNESAPSHLAAAVGTCAVIPFLSGNDARRWGPAGSGHLVVEGEPGLGPVPATVAAAVLERLRENRDPGGCRADQTDWGGQAR